MKGATLHVNACSPLFQDMNLKANMKIKFCKLPLPPSFREGRLAVVVDALDEKSIQIKSNNNPPRRKNMKNVISTVLSISLCTLVLNGCFGNDENKTDANKDAQRLFVAHDGMLAAWNLSTMEQIPGEIQNVKGPTDMQALEDGTLLVNLTDNNEVLIVNGTTMLEKARIHSSTIGGTRPVHSYLSPVRNGKQYWVALNDGDGTKASNSARFIDIMAGSAKYLSAVGEVALGLDHHKASFSNTKERIVISNIGDCDDVLSVFDYSDPAHISKLATLSAVQAGWNDSNKICDQTYQKGVPPGPHGCETSKVSGKAYCNLSGSGEIVAVNIDATPPTFSIIASHGSGGGYTKSHPDGRYVYTLEGDPREGSKYNPGAACQIGQLVVIDATKDSVVKELPLLYKGPACHDSISKTDEGTTEPAHLIISHDKQKLYVQTAGGWKVDAARVREQLVFDISTPGNPVQLPSIPIGASNSYHGETLSGDGKYLFEANNMDGTVTQIDAATATVIKTFPVKAKPKYMATWGKVEGPSHQTGPIE